MKHLLMVVLAIIMLITFGCAGVTVVPKHDFMDDEGEIIAVGERYNVVVIKTRDWVSPATTTVMVYDKETGAFEKVEGGTGASGIGQLAGPAAVGYAGHRIGRGLEDSGDRNVVNNGSGSNAIQGQAQGQLQGQLQNQTQQDGFSNRNSILDF